MGTRLMNNARTAMLMTAMFVLVMVIGLLVGRIQGLVIAFVIGGVLNFVAYFASDKIALATMRGQQVDERTAPDLVHMVERLARNAGLPMPKVYVCPQEAPNAFATGRSPKHAAVAVTNGALRLLSYEELEGVMAHELAHVKNRDTLTSTIAATIAGAIFFFTRIAIWFGSDRNSPLGIVGLLLMMILAPIAAMLIQAAISRSREFAADADGARIAGTPEGLKAALVKLEATARQVPMEAAMPSQNHMFIVHPLSGMGMANLFSTHPPTRDRVARLSRMR